MNLEPQVPIPQARQRTYMLECPDQWDEAVDKLTPHESQEGPPLREDIALERWHPTPREYSHAISKLKRNKAANAGGRTTETAQGWIDILICSDSQRECLWKRGG